MNVARNLGLLTILCLLCTACAHTSGIRDIEPGKRPPDTSVEGGLWMHVESLEHKLATSGRVVKDPALNAYVRELICKLTPEHCDYIRFYIVHTPHFNATMAPNGFMEIWTGLLLRAENEAQLSYILGHEIAHYLRRHTLQRWQAVKSTLNTIMVMDLAAGTATVAGVPGVGIAGDTVSIVAVAGLFAYSREHEREADKMGLEMMTEAGYDPHEAVVIWEAIMKERDATDDTEPLIWFSTHPGTEERIATLKALAAEFVGEHGSGYIGRAQFAVSLRPFRKKFLQDELKRRKFAASQVVLERLFNTNDTPGELHFFQGELFRARGDEGDLEQGIASYQKAIATGGAPTETHRCLGLMYWRGGDKVQARAAFERYLQLSPDAPDHAMVRSYLQQLK